MRSVLAAAMLAAALVGCGGSAGSSALGYAQAPASLDPNSPTLAAKDIAFTKSELDVPAGAPFILVFENQDTVSHNVSIYPDATSTTKLFDGVLFAGPSTRWYPMPALAAGTYAFKCDLHPNMTGTLRAS
ncbi:MAG TPA: cupredoxin domain-containing protein [Candidatus Limnocylindrales bacterium]|nr:cupredoxin domain-containing protein [Candidatus Limnocylindrales bacterium]